MAEASWSAGTKFVTVELPDLLQLYAASLRKLPLGGGGGISELRGLSLQDKTKLIPLAGTLLVLLAWAARSRHTAAVANKQSTYWLTRLVLLRGMGLIYLAAFATTATQGRALFGEHGLLGSSLQGSGRPTPAFDWVAAHGLRRGDLALELVAWTGEGSCRV